MPVRASLPVLFWLVLVPAAWAQPNYQPNPGPLYGQPPPRSHYADGTGNSDVDRLNAGQLDRNYRGPWHPVPPGRGMILPNATVPDSMLPGAMPSGPVPLAPMPPPPGQF